MENSKIFKKKRQAKIRKERYIDRIKNTPGVEGDKLRKKHARKVRASKKKTRLNILKNDPVKKLRRVVILIENIDWDYCVDTLKIESSAESLVLRPASYLKNKKQPTQRVARVFSFLITIFNKLDYIQ